MKGISPMIATVLLIAFTVAVGGILAVWFSTYTKTQTSSVSKSSSCASTTLDVSVPVVSSDGTSVTLLITNKGPSDVNITAISVICGSNTPHQENTAISLSAGQSITHDVSSLSGCTKDNVAVDVFATCTSGGTTRASCPEGAC